MKFTVTLPFRDWLATVTPTPLKTPKQRDDLLNGDAPHHQPEERRLFDAQRINIFLRQEAEGTRHEAEGTRHEATAKEGAGITA